MQKKFYITTAIDYINAQPHLGHAYEKILADTFARWQRFKGNEVFFLTGVDEHGEKVLQSIRGKNLTPEQYCRQMEKSFLNLCQVLNISNDDFICTTQPRHCQTVEKFISRIYANGDIYKGIYEGYYCVECEAYLTKDDLVEGKCPQHKCEPETRHEENYFFRQSKYQSRLLEHINNNPSFVQPPSRLREIISFLTKHQLEDVSISRQNLTWGIPLPFDNSQTIYVWVDALLNYLSAIGSGSVRPGLPDGGQAIDSCWPADVHLIGKDILRFHTVLWPALLMSAQLPLPRHIFVHGFITSRGEKMSKSLGNAVDPFELVNRFGTDATRYYFLSTASFGQDCDYTESNFLTRYNADLANNFGNLINRSLFMIEKYFQGVIPAPGENLGQDRILQEMTVKLAEKVNKWLEKFEFNNALKEICELSTRANRYIEQTRPWDLNKTDRTRLGTVLYNLTQLIYILAGILGPFMPETSEKILSQLGITGGTKNLHLTNFGWGNLSPGKKIEKPEPIFPRQK